MSPLANQFQEIAAAYGPAVTKAMKEGDVSDLKNLCVEHAPVEVAMQNAQGQEIIFTIFDGELTGDSEAANLTWAQFQSSLSVDLQQQDYDRTISECGGVLADRMILNAARINSKDEMYAEANYVVTLDAESGKIAILEAFADLNVTNLLQAVEK